MATSKIRLLVDAGKATAGPPLGPALAPMGVNPGQVVAQINTQTKQYDGMTVPVTIVVNTSDKSFALEIGMPPTSSFIKKAIGVELGAKGEAEKGQETVGNITMKQIHELLEKKETVLLFKNKKNAVKQFIGTCVSMGVTVEGLPAKKALKSLEDGSLSL